MCACSLLQQSFTACMYNTMSIYSESGGGGSWGLDPPPPLGPRHRLFNIGPIRLGPGPPPLCVPTYVIGIQNVVPFKYPASAPE